MSEFVTGRPRIPMIGLGAIGLQEGVWLQEEHQPIEAALANGRSLRLPYTRLQSWTRLGTGYQTSELQDGIYYHRLGKSAREAIHQALNDSEPLEQAAKPRYKRLALNAADALHTVKHQHDRAQRLYIHLGLDALSTAPDDPELDSPVVSARSVCSSYAAIPFIGELGQRTAYWDQHINLFGPGPDSANAFWVSGNPLVVCEPTGNLPGLTRPPTTPGQDRTPRWTVIPLRFYQIEEQPKVPGLPSDMRQWNRLHR